MFLKYVFLSKKAYAHLLYVWNICATFQIDSLNSMGGVNYTKVPFYISQVHKIPKSGKANFVKYILSVHKGDWHCQYACNIGVKFQTGCWKLQVE